MPSKHAFLFFLVNINSFCDVVMLSGEINAFAARDHHIIIILIENISLNRLVKTDW